MGNVPIHRRLIRRLTKNSSGTLSVSIPIEHALELQWQKGKHVEVVRQGESVVIKSVKPKRGSHD